jgi:hypothetical protein
MPLPEPIIEVLAVFRPLFTKDLHIELLSSTIGRETKHADRGASQTYMDTSTQQILDQIAPYQPWLITLGVIVLFVLLRATRNSLRRRVDIIGYHLLHERGSLLWFWLNAPGVMIHELSHALAILLFTPFGFRITRITLFRIRPTVQRNVHRRVIRNHAGLSLQLGEVQYKRPTNRLMSYIGDGLSGIAPLIGGTLAFMFLYWTATGYNLWDFPFDPSSQRWQFLRPGWPWWTLLFTPYLILTVTSELWPSRQDWSNARWFVVTLALLLLTIGVLLWLTHTLLPLIPSAIFIASHIDFALLVLIALDLVFLLFAEMIVQLIQR